MTRRQIRSALACAACAVVLALVGAAGLYLAVMRAPEAARRAAAADGLPTSREELALRSRPDGEARTSRPSWLPELRRLRNNAVESALFAALEPVREFRERGEPVDAVREAQLAELRAARRAYAGHVALGDG